jgi:hypothetical protein
MNELNVGDRKFRRNHKKVKGAVPYGVNASPQMLSGLASILADAAGAKNDITSAPTKAHVEYTFT